MALNQTYGNSVVRSQPDTDTPGTKNRRKYTSTFQAKEQETEHHLNVYIRMTHNQTCANSMVRS